MDEAGAHGGPVGLGGRRPDGERHPRGGHADHCEGDHEESGRYPESREGAHREDQEAGETGAGELPDPLQRLAEAGESLEGNAAVGGDIEGEGFARARARAVEHRAEGHQGDQNPEIESHRGIGEGNRDHGKGTERVGGHTHPLSADSVDDGAAEERGQHQRADRRGRDEPGQRRVSGAFEHEPGDDHADDRVSGDRERVGQEQSDR